MSEEVLSYKITADIDVLEQGLKTAEKGFEDLSNKAKNEGKKVDESFENVGKSATDNLNKGLTDAGKSFEDLSSKAKKECRNIDNSLGGLGNNIVGGLTDSLRDAGQSLEELTNKAKKEGGNIEEALNEAGDNVSDSFSEALEEAGEGLEELSEKAEEQGAEIDDTFKKIGKSIAAVFTLQQAGKFIKKMAEVRGEFQQLEVAFATMLQSKNKANSLMNEVINLAATTPFDVNQVANGAKQLLAYGSEAENISDELTRLGNIAAGLSIPLNDMVYLFGTTRTQGRLFTQDLRQFMGRGIPLADELAKQFGVTKDKVGELVTAGKIGFPEVEKAIKSMTNEGGKFYNLMGEQSKTVAGQVSNLGDAIEQMFNEIGRSNEGVMSKSLDMASNIVEHYKEIGRILSVLVSTYGSYKAIVITLNAINKVKSALLLAEAANVNKLRAAVIGLTSAKRVETAVQLANNKALLMNPYVAVVAAITGAIVATTKFIKKNKELAEEQRNWTRDLNKGVTEAEKMEKTYNKLKTAAEKAKPGTEEYTKALHELGNAYPEFAGKFAELDKPFTNELERQKKLSELLEDVKIKYLNIAKAKAISEAYTQKVSEQELLEEEIKSNMLGKLDHNTKERKLYGGKNYREAKKILEDWLKNNFSNDKLIPLATIQEELRNALFGKNSYVSEKYAANWFYDLYDDIKEYQLKQQQVKSLEKKYEKELEISTKNEFNSNVEDQNKNETEEEKRRRAEEAKKRIEKLNKAKEDYEKASKNFIDGINRSIEDFIIEIMDNTYEQGSAKIDQKYDDMKKAIEGEYKELELMAKDAGKALSEDIKKAYENGLEGVESGRKREKSLLKETYIEDINNYIRQGESELSKCIDDYTKKYSEIINKIEKLDLEENERTKLKSEAHEQYIYNLSKIDVLNGAKQAENIDDKIKQLESIIDALKGEKTDIDVCDLLGINEDQLNKLKQSKELLTSIEELLDKLKEQSSNSLKKTEEELRMIADRAKSIVSNISSALMEINGIFASQYDSAEDDFKYIRSAITNVGAGAAAGGWIGAIVGALKTIAEVAVGIFTELRHRDPATEKRTREFFQNSMYGLLNGGGMNRGEYVEYLDRRNPDLDYYLKFFLNRFYSETFGHVNFSSYKRNSGSMGFELEIPEYHITTVQDIKYLFKEFAETFLDLNDELKNQLSELVDFSDSFVKGLERVLKNFNSISGNLFGKDYIDAARAASQAATILETDAWANYRFYLDEAFRYQISSGDRMSKKEKESLEVLRNEAAEYEDAALNYADMKAGIQSAIMEMLTGFSSIVEAANEFSSTFVNAFIEANDISSSLGNVVRNSLIQGLTTMMTGQWYADFHNFLLHIWDDNQITQDEMDMIPDWINWIKSESQSAIESMQPVVDMINSLGDASDRAGLSKGIEGMSQDTATELNGRFTAIQAQTAMIGEDVGFLRTNSSQQLVYLSRIQSNTASLIDIKNDIQYIRNHGVNIL